MNQIGVKIIADSISNDRMRIVTYELEYPRFIHAELMTHRLFSRNAASSRAIPIQKMMDMVMSMPASPIEWGVNQAGMQAKELLSGGKLTSAIWAWGQAAKSASKSADALEKVGLHKQIVNRVLEPFQTMKTIVTATEYDNWFWLRNHSDAQPEIKELAAQMLEAMAISVPNTLEPGEWHLPYIISSRSNGVINYYTNSGQEVTLDEAKKISSSCCAQVSYRLLNDALDKALSIYDKLVTSTPVHASVFEHQATPMKVSIYDWNNTYYGWEEGVTHLDRDGYLWSGNFRGWVQHRQLIPGNVCYKYVEEKSCQ